MKYVPSLMVGQLSRSAGSTTASRNRFGSYFRTRINPVNPNTTKQQLQRANMEDLSETWKSLTAVQQAAWASLGLQIVRSDTLGQTYTLTGLQAYTSLNMVNRRVGQSDVTAAPAMPATPANMLTLSAVYDTTPITGTGLDVTFTPTPIPAGSRVVIEATRPVSAGKSFMPRSEYKVVFIGAVAGTSPQDITTVYQAIYGVAPAGSKVFFRAYTVDANGFKSLTIEATTIVI